MTIENPTSFQELYDAFNMADNLEVQDFTDFAEKSTENRVTLLEKRLTIMGVCFNKALLLLAEKDGKSPN